MKKGIISVLALILSLGALAGVRINTAKANTGVTYYVSSSEGDDANDGTSEDKPFRTFSNINGKLLGAGDKVLLKRGDVWNERLEILAQGTSDNFVEISCYGNADLDKPTIRMNEGDDDVCVLVKDFYYNGQRPVQHPFRYLKINNLYLRDARLGIFLRTYACINEENESMRNRDVYISDVDIDNMFAPAMKEMIDREREIEGYYIDSLPREQWPSITSECAERVNALIKDELDKPKCNLPMIENGIYSETGGGGAETIFPAGIFMGGKKPAVYSVTEGAQVDNMDRTYPALTNLKVENVNITESCTGIMSWYYYYNGTKGVKIWKNTLTNLSVNNVLVTGSINGGLALDATDGGAVAEEDGSDVNPSSQGWGLINNLRVLAGSSKDGGTFINGSCGAIINNSKNLVINESEFAGVNNQDNPDGCGLDFESCTENVKLINSYFHNNAGGAILIMDSDKGPHKNLLIKNNVLYNNLVDGYNGGPRAWDYQDKRYIQLYNVRNRNIVFENNKILLSRENKQGTPLLLDPFIGPVSDPSPSKGGFTLIDNVVGYFENSKSPGYIPFKTYHNVSVTGGKVTLEDLSVNHLIYRRVYLKADNNEKVSGKISVKTLDGKEFSPVKFSTDNGVVNLTDKFALNSAITEMTVELDDTSAARMELEFILDTERNVVISGKNTARVYLSGESKATFSDEMTVGDFAVNYFGFGNGIKSVKKLLGNVTEITFENNLTEKQKEILLYGDSVNIAPGAFVRVFREIYEGKEPNRSVNKKSYYYVSSLSVTSLPEKLVYDSGADIDLLGMAVTATYGDGTQGPLSYAKFSVNGYDANKTGEQTVELKYLDKTYYLTVETSYDNEGNAPSGAKGGCKGSAGIGLVSGIIVLASSLIFIGRKR